MAWRWELWTCNICAFTVDEKISLQDLQLKGKFKLLLVLNWLAAKWTCQKPLCMQTSSACFLGRSLQGLQWSHINSWDCNLRNLSILDLHGSNIHIKGIACGLKMCHMMYHCLVYLYARHRHQLINTARPQVLQDRLKRRICFQWWCWLIRLNLKVLQLSCTYKDTRTMSSLIKNREYGCQAMLPSCKHGVSHCKLWERISKHHHFLVSTTNIMLMNRISCLSWAQCKKHVMKWSALFQWYLCLVHLAHRAMRTKCDEEGSQ